MIHSKYDNIDLENSSIDASLSNISGETQICRYQVDATELRSVTSEDRNEYNMICFSCIFLTSMLIIGIAIMIVITIKIAHEDN